MKGRQIEYMPEELAWIEARKEWPRARLHSAFCFFFDRTDVTVGALNALCKRKGWLTGRTGCFVKGQEPPNKGKPMTPEVRAKVAATMFRKGNRTGRANLNYKPIGTERVNDEGYLERKINDDLPFKDRWRLVHLLNWEALHGPVPEGMCLKCRDGNRQNTDPSNWQLIERALLPVLNGGKWGRLAYDKAAPEVKPALMAIAELRVAKSRMKKPAQEATS